MNSRVVLGLLITGGLLTQAADGAVISDAASSLLAADGSYSSMTATSIPTPKAKFHDNNTSTVITYLRTSIGQGFGYDFAGMASVSSFFVGQNSSGPRKEISTARVYYTGGYTDVTFSLADTQTVTLSQPVTTGFIYVSPLTVGGAGNNEPAITEFYVNGVAPGTPRANVLSGLTGSSVTALGWWNTYNTVGWNAATGGRVTDGLMAYDGNNAHPDTIWIDPALVVSASNNYIQFDLGAAKTTNTLGFSQPTGGSGFDRNIFTSVRLEFSNDPTFVVGVTGFDFASLAPVGYMQLDFAPTTARYARFIATGRETGGTDNYGGVVEVQLYTFIPEPGVLSFGLCAMALALSRRPRAWVRQARR